MCFQILMLHFSCKLYRSKKKYIMEKKTSSTVVHILEKMLSKEWRCVTNKTVFFMWLQLKEEYL